MATRTARGTATSKTSGTTLTIPSFTVPQGHSLVVGAAYANGALAPTSVTHAGRTLRRRQQQDNATRSIHASMWVKGEYHKDQTGTCVLTWSSAIVERAAFATSLDIAINKDDGSGNAETVTTATPATGSTGALILAGLFVAGTKYEIVTVGTTDFTAVGAASNTVGLVFTATGIGLGTGTAREALEASNAFAIACFGAEGPSGDGNPTTVEIRDNGSLATATLGQRAGTTGGGAASNITVIESYLQLTTDHFTRGRLVVPTNRRWVNCILALKERPSFNRQGITPTDIGAVDQIVEDAGGDPDDVYFGFNDQTGQWEAYETATPGTLRATRDDAGTWS